MCYSNNLRVLFAYHIHSTWCNAFVCLFVCFVLFCVVFCFCFCFLFCFVFVFVFCFVFCFVLFLFCFVFCLFDLFWNMVSRPVARGCGGCDAPPPQSAKRSTFSHKVGQKWGFCRRVRGGEVQKSPLFGSKRSTFGGSRTPTKINPGYGPDGIWTKF